VGRWTGLVASKASIRSSFRVVKTTEQPPHAEGMAQPKDFFTNVATFPPDEQELIMRGNARRLTFD
jgi:hypothetical protein